jgi:hypothetical protein
MSRRLFVGHPNFHDSLEWRIWDRHLGPEINSEKKLERLVSILRAWQNRAAARNRYQTPKGKVGEAKPCVPAGWDRSSNPLHFLIETLTRFIDAVWACHQAPTADQRERALNAWSATKDWFWPQYRLPSDAIRGLADQALSRCSKTKLPDEEYAKTIESGAEIATALAKLTGPCAAPGIYANRTEAEERWNRQGEFLFRAKMVRDALKQIAARAGEPWPPAEPQIAGSTGRDHSEVGKGSALPKGKRGRGRPRDTDPEMDKRIFDAWKTGDYKSEAELAREFNISEREVRLARDRHRKRSNREADKRRTNSSDK